MALDASGFAPSMPFPARHDARHHGQGDFIMAAHDQRCRMAAHLLLVLALGIPCLVVGCEGGGSDAAAPVDAAQAKKVQNYMTNYRDQIIADNKAKAKAKTTGKVAEKAAEPQSP